MFYNAVVFGSDLKRSLRLLVGKWQRGIGDEGRKVKRRSVDILTDLDFKILGMRRFFKLIFT